MQTTRLAASLTLAVLLLGACSPTDPAAAPGASPSVALTTPVAAATTPPADVPTPAEPTPGDSATPSAPEPPTQSLGSATAVPALTYAGPGTAEGTYELSGVVPGIVENGGRCTFRLTSGTVVVERHREGLADASSTTCGTVEVPVADLTSGRWSVTLSYAGDLGQGTSAASEVVVP